MRLSIDRLRPFHLVLASIGYWVTLAAVKLTPGVVAGWKLSRPDAHGSITVSLDNTVLKVTMSREAAVVWSGAVSLPLLALMIVGPPLLLWFLWVIRRPRKGAENAPARLMNGDLWPGPRSGRVGDEVPVSRGDGKTP